jgi:hypothetical protein
MVRNYYSSRVDSCQLSLADFYGRTNSLFQIFRHKDYFHEKTGIGANDSSKSLYHESNLYLGFAAFPIHEWRAEDITPAHIFDVIEFLWDRVSKPGEYGEMYTSSGSVYGYFSYDEVAGRKEFGEAANVILAQWDSGFEISKEGSVQALGTHGLQYILSAEIVGFDEVNVDSKVRSALIKWQGRSSTTSDKKEAVRLMADVFEFLKKSNQLRKALDSSDSSDLFHIANEFAIRHHTPKQKRNYDTGIWYAWMFHFYLATYHASIRLIDKKAKSRPNMKTG